MAARKTAGEGGAKRGRPAATVKAAGVMLHLPETQVLALQRLATLIRENTGAKGVNRSTIVRAALGALLLAGPDLSACGSEGAIRDAIVAALKKR